jgi:flagellar biosynthesis/type III secretory pathway chaperone
MDANQAEELKRLLEENSSTGLSSTDQRRLREIHEAASVEHAEHVASRRDRVAEEFQELKDHDFDSGCSN